MLQDGASTRRAVFFWGDVCALGAAIFRSRPRRRCCPNLREPEISSQSFIPAAGCDFICRLHDIIASEKPALIVTLGLGDAQAHLTFCQTAAHQNISSRCAAIRRATLDEDAADDPGW